MEYSLFSSVLCGNMKPLYSFLHCQQICGQMDEFLAGQRDSRAAELGMARPACSSCTIRKKDVVKKIRVCCFCERWESGGIESFLNNLLLHMDISHMEVDLVAAELKESVFSQCLRDRGVHFRELSGSQRRLTENYRLFHKLLSERQYDVVHLNIFHGMSLYYVHLAKRAGIPTRIAHSHNTDLRESPTRRIKIWLHRLYSSLYAPDATALWACSNNAAQFMFPAKLLKTRGFTFIPNGIDTKGFHFVPAVRETMRQKLGLTDQFVIGNVGRLCYQKNQNFLLEIFSQVIKLRPESHLLLVGEGEDLGMLQEKALALGIEDRMTFYGVTKQVEQLLWAMDTFVFPSRFEGLGIVAVEAQAAGLRTFCSENVPEEAAVSPLFYRISLDKSAEFWAQEILTPPAGEPDRNPDQTGCAKFDISNVVRIVESSYKGSSV